MLTVGININEIDEAIDRLKSVATNLSEAEDYILAEDMAPDIIEAINELQFVKYSIKHQYTQLKSA